MKISAIKYFLGVLASTLIISSALAQSASEINTLGNTIITSLKNNDASGFLQAHITDKDLPELEKTYASKGNDAQKNDMEESLQSMQDEFSAQFEEIIQKGIQDQINWKEVEFSRVETSGEPQKDGNLQVLENPVVVFSYKNQERKLNLGKVAKLTRGWVVLDKISMQ